MTWPQGVYVCALLVLVACLYRGHRAGKIDLWELVTATDKSGRTRTDSRKLFECGAFLVMSIAFSYLAMLDKLSEAYLFIYAGSWVTARIMRDREQRLNRKIDLDVLKPKEANA